MEKFAIIVAGGVGQRFHAELPKQFLPLCGRPMLLHTLERFAKALPDVRLILALRPTLFDLWYEIVDQHAFSLPVSLSEGGEERFHTVSRALALVPDEALVAIHDAVRPLVSEETIRRAFELAALEGSAVPVVAPSDSVRVSDEAGFVSFPRDRVRLVQTPQTFRAEEIKQAYRTEFSPKFTDDASVFETVLGRRVSLFEGNRENIKITYPWDLVVAEAILRESIH